MNTRTSRTSMRRIAVALTAVAALALTGCSDNLTDVERAQAQVTAKEQAVTEAQDAFAAASATFCSESEDYVRALDVYGDVLNDTAPTVGDVQNAGADLVGPREAATSAAQAAVDAQNDVIAAQQELIDAQAALAIAQAGPSGDAETPEAATPSATPLAPVESVDRVRQAEKDFDATVQGITDRTPLREATEQFQSSALALELSWIKLFVDTGCATDAQIKRAHEEVTSYTLALQQALADAGYYSGAVDGIYGPQTVDAIKELQEAHDLPTTGFMDKATAAALQADLVELGFTIARDSLASTAALQQTLTLLGFWEEPVDGVWSDELTEAVKEAQTALGVEPTGVVDAATVKAFEEALAKVQELVAEATPSPSPSPTPSPSPSPTATATA